MSCSASSGGFVSIMPINYVVPGCDNVQGECQYSFHHFPAGNDERLRERCKRWKQLFGEKDGLQQSSVEFVFPLCYR